MYLMRLNHALHLPSPKKRDKVERELVNMVTLGYLRSDPVSPIRVQLIPQ